MRSLRLSELVLQNSLVTFYLLPPGVGLGHTAEPFCDLARQKNKAQKPDGPPCTMAATATNVRHPEVLGVEDLTPPSAKWLKLKCLQVGGLLLCAHTASVSITKALTLLPICFQPLPTVQGPTGQVRVVPATAARWLVGGTLAAALVAHVASLHPWP